LVVTVSGTAYNDENDISTVTLYDVDGTTALSNPVAYGTAGTDDTIDTFTFASTDFLNPIIFTKGAYKTFLIKANCAEGIDGTSNLYLTIADGASQFKTEGMDSGTAYDLDSDISADLNLKFTSPYAGGEFAFDKEILEIKKAADSPTSISRTSAETVAIWDVTNMSSTLDDITIDEIKFTTKTGWDPDLSLADGADEEDYFKLYDEAGNLLSSGKSEVDLDTGTVTFTKPDMLTVKAGEPKQLRLVIDLTNTTDWTSGLQIHMTIAAYGDLTSSEGYVGYAGTVWSIPADANIVKVP